MFPQLPFNFFSPKKFTYAHSDLVVPAIELTGLVDEAKFSSSDLIISTTALTSQADAISLVLSDLVIPSVSFELLPPVASAFDSDAQTVINAIDATGALLSGSQKNAINNRITSAKSDGVWLKWTAYYGFVGGTANAHAINWKNPSSYLMTWNGTVAHNANGVKGNGTTGYGNTGVNPSVVLGINNCGLGFYLTEAKPSSQSWDSGGAVGSRALDLAIFLNTAYNDIGSIGLTSPNTGGKQYLSGNVSGGSNTSLYVNGSSVVSSSVAGLLPSTNMFICAYSDSNTASLFSIARFGSFSINAGLTNTEETANYISELAFQTALSRN